MNRFAQVLVVGIATVCIAGVAFSQSSVEPRSQLVAKVKPSVTKIMVESSEGESVGSGFLFDPHDLYGDYGSTLSQKFFLGTNNHVVCDENGKPARKVEVQFVSDDSSPSDRLFGGRSYAPVFPMPGHVVGCDPLSDLAVVEIEPKVLSLDDVPPSLHFARRTEIHVGDSVIAVGFAFNYAGEPSVTAGSISGLHRSLKGMFSGLVQTDATINHGNSGGPLINTSGRIVGVNTYTAVPKLNEKGEVIGPWNVFYARSSETAAPFLKALADHGRLVRADLGLNEVEVMNPVPSDTYLYNGGVRVDSFAEDSPAENAGLKTGDVILEVYICPADYQPSWSPLACMILESLGEAKISTVGDLMNELAFIKPGSWVALDILRAGCLRRSDNCPKRNSVIAVHTG